MSSDGYVNEGADPRLLGKIGALIQRAFSFSCSYESITLILGFPPFLALNLPLPIKSKEILHFRLGWRYDYNFKHFIFSIALKKKSRAFMY